MALHMILLYGKYSLSPSRRIVHIILEHTKTIASYSTCFRYLLVYT